jgi:hypothetical protein
MSRASLGGAVIVFSAVAAVIFAGVAVHELSCASGHPYAFGPAKVIAWGGAAGALPALAVNGLAVALLRWKS